MKTATDFEPFRSLMDQLCAAWNRPQSDEVVRAYWGALNDAPFQEIERNVKRILRTATRKDPWPKPGDLRDEAPSDVKQDSHFEAGEQRSIRNLEELKRENEDAWRREVRLRYLDRRIATEWEGSPIYAQAKREWLQLRGLA